MSLQPLDSTPDVAEAYKLALSESRRWYLPLSVGGEGLAYDRVVLAYSSRSALCLRGQGIGLPDLRKHLEEEDEVLFGFLRFRRRGIVLQYTNPECSRVVKGTSSLIFLLLYILVQMHFYSFYTFLSLYVSYRFSIHTPIILSKSVLFCISGKDIQLIPARAQVHLQTVLNYFRDNDFLLETSTPKDITLDNIARLTNSTSTSTINSSKKSKRLTDIMEESPIIGAGGELLLENEDGDGQSSPLTEGSSDAGSGTGVASVTEEMESNLTSPSLKPPRREGRNERLHVKLGGSGGRSLSPTPVKLRTPSNLRLPPSPTNTSDDPNQRDSYGSTTSPSPSTEGSEPDIPRTPTQDTPSTQQSLPLTPPTPPSPSKLRLLKALEMRRLKMSGQPVVLVSKTFQVNHSSHQSLDSSHKDFDGSYSLRAEKPVTPPPEATVPGSGIATDHKARLQAAKRSALAAKRALIEEQKMRIAALENSGRDLLSGWVNFQSSTSLVSYLSPSRYSLVIFANPFPRFTMIWFPSLELYLPLNFRA